MNNMFRLTIPAVAALLLAAGCAVDQKSEVKIYRKVLDPPGAAKDAAPDSALLRIEPGQTLTLTWALRLANQNEERLNIQGESYLQSLIEKDRKFSAFLPTVNFEPSYSQSDPSHKFPSPNHHTLNAPFVGTINVFNGFRDINALRQEDSTIEQQKQLLLDLQQSVLLEVAQTYFQVLTAEQSVDVLSNSLYVQKQRVDQIHQRVHVGTARELDVAQAQAQESQTQVSLLQAKANVRNARSLLSYLIDAPVQDNPLSDDYQPPDALPAQEIYARQAEAARQDLLAAQNATLAARKQVDIAFGQYYPSINIDLTGFAYKESQPTDSIWSALISMNLPIFTGGQIEADVRIAWSQFRQAAMTEWQLRRKIDDDVFEAYENLQLSRHELDELAIEVDAAKQALFLADQQYLNGKGTLLDRLLAQDQLLTSQLQLTTQQFQQKTTYLNLLRVTGKLSLTIADMPATRPVTRSNRSLATQPAVQPSEVNPASRPAPQPSTHPSPAPILNETRP